MKNKIFIFFAIVTLFLSFILGIMIYKNMLKKDMIGDLVFSKVILEIDNLDRISISNNENSYDFFIKDGLWRIKQADGYYVDHKIFESLFSDIYNSKFYSFMDNENDDVFISYNKIDFYKNTDEKIDSISIGSKNQNSYSFAQKDGKFSLLSGKFTLPQKKFSWIEQPSFNITFNNIVRPESSELSNSLKAYFAYMFFEDVLSIDNFNYKIIESKIISIETQNGLIVDMNVFRVESGYWSRDRKSVV